MLERIKQLSFLSFIRHKSIRNFFFLFLIQSSNILVSLLAMPLLIRSIGVAEFGLVNLSFSVILLFNVMVSYGYNLSGPRDIALSGGSVSVMGERFSEILWSKLTLALFAFLMIAILGFIFGFFEDYWVILCWSTILLFAEATTLVWFFQGRESLHWVSIANIFSKLVYLLLLTAFIKEPSDSFLANFLLGSTALIANLGLIVYICFGMNIQISWPKFSHIWNSWRKNIQLFFSALTAHVAVNGGVIILSFFASAQILGLYGMAERIGMVLRIAPALITQSAYPRASVLFANEPEKFYPFLKKVQWSSLLLNLLISLTVFYLAPFIIKVMAGNVLEESVLFLKILAFLPFLAALNIGNMLVILAMDQKVILLHATWVFCLYMLLAAIFLAKVFGGTGLALALISTELVAYISTSYLLYKHQPQAIIEFYNVLFGRHHHT
ncbi:oligosaccharide flippase family protein [Cyclobacterium plantarum]|uniref:oligosaccharide flippase family protein n=1 Tax=Cyclobacterium plantarum TaxID=2716263 RepID=UPI003F71AF72